MHIHHHPSIEPSSIFAALIIVTATFGGAATCAAQPASDKQLPQVLVLSTGGTIAGKGASSTSLAEYKSGSIQRDELVNAVPEAARPVIVRSNRTGNGRVIPRKEYDDLGYVPADTLNPQKARILLMLALTLTHDLAEIRRMFNEF